VSSVNRDISKQKNWVAEKSKLSSRPSIVGIRLEKINYDPKRVERRKKKKCCGR
jgi:hypothetical protein